MRRYPENKVFAFLITTIVCQNEIDEDLDIALKGLRNKRVGVPSGEVTLILDFVSR